MAASFLGFSFVPLPVSAPDVFSCSVKATNFLEFVESGGCMSVPDLTNQPGNVFFCFEASTSVDAQIMVVTDIMFRTGWHLVFQQPDVQCLS